MLTPPSVCISPPQECVSKPWAMIESEIVMLETAPLIENVSSEQDIGEYWFDVKLMMYLPRPHEALTWSKIMSWPSAEGRTTLVKLGSIMHTVRALTNCDSILPTIAALTHTESNVTGDGMMGIGVRKALQHQMLS